MAATFRDARAGFDIFRSSGGHISREDLNVRLIRADYRPVSPRMMDHYRSLLKEGYSRYVSINRFDVARASVPYENAAAIGRYDYQAVDLGVNVIFAKGSRLLEAQGRAYEIGDVGAMLHFPGEEVVAGLRKLKPQPGNMVTIRFFDAGRTVGGRVVEADLLSDPPVVEIQYSRLISLAEIGVGSPLPAREASFVLSGPGDPEQTLELVNRRLYHFFELIEGLRSLVNEAGSRQSEAVYAEPPILRSLRVSNPAYIWIEVAEMVVGLIPEALFASFLTLVAKLPAKRKEWYEGTGQKIANELREELKQLEIQEKDLIWTEKRWKPTFRRKLLVG